MVKRTGPTNIILREVIKELRKTSAKEKVNVWKRVAEDLEKPTRIRRKVNVYKLSEYIKKDEVAVVPGVVLGNGDFNKKNTVAAFKFTESAKNKINETGKALSLLELLKKNPKGKKVRIIG